MAEGLRPLRVRLRRPLLAAALTLASLSLLAPLRANAAGTGEQPVSTVTTAASSRLGTYLTDGAGHALYFSTADLPGASNCTSGCLAVWPPFFADRLSVASPLQRADFGFIVRDKGRRQVTYRGWPLYYYSRDWAPGDTNGQGLYDRWYVVQPALFGPSPK